MTELWICESQPWACSFAGTRWKLLVNARQKAFWWKACFGCHGAECYLPVGMTINLGCLREMEPASRSRFNDLWAVITPVTFGCFILMKYSRCSSQNGSLLQTNVSLLPRFVCFVAWQRHFPQCSGDQKQTSGLHLLPARFFTTLGSAPSHWNPLEDKWREKKEQITDTFGDVRGSVLFCGALGPRSGCWWAVGNSWSFCRVQDGVIFIIHPQWCIDLLLLLLFFLSFLLFLLACSDCSSYRTESHDEASACCCSATVVSLTLIDSNMVPRKNGEDAQRMEVNSSKTRWWKEEMGVHYWPDGASSSLSPTCCAHRFVHAGVATVLRRVQHGLKQRQQENAVRPHPSIQPSLNLRTISLSVHPSIHTLIDPYISIHPFDYYPFVNLSILSQIFPSIHPPVHSFTIHEWCPIVLY